MTTVRYHKDGSKTIFVPEFNDPGKIEEDFPSDPDHRTTVIWEGDHQERHGLDRTARLRSPEMAGVNIDDRDLTFHGDAIKTLHERVIGNRIEQTFVRVDDTGKYKGEYRATWEKTDNGQLTHTETRRARE